MVRDTIAMQVNIMPVLVSGRGFTASIAVSLASVWIPKRAFLLEEVEVVACSGIRGYEPNEAGVLGMPFSRQKSLPIGDTLLVSGLSVFQDVAGNSPKPPLQLLPMFGENNGSR